jgi:nitrate reductase gamma subunit
MLAMRAYMFVIFLGHFVGLLTPIQVFDALGISHTSKQWMAIGIGGLASAVTVASEPGKGSVFTVRLPAGADTH